MSALVAVMVVRIMKRPERIVILLLSISFLLACAAGPGFHLDNVGPELTAPRDVVSMQPFPQGKRIVWGGQIIGMKNLVDRSRIELLAYPLDGRQRPILDEPSMGRFLVDKRGFLEPADYAPGRLLTVTGKLLERVQGKVGEAPYDYPLVEADVLYLWSQPSEGLSWRGIRFGIGISISN